MPEHETFDLDSAFASLERDIAGVSSPRGADLAVSTARRRRRTTFGAVAAVALLTVGGVAVTQGHGSSSVGPSGELPPPATFDKAALTTATAGWTSAWADPTRADSRAYNQLDLGCLDTIKGGSAQDPAKTGDFTAVNADGGLAFGNLGDFGTQAAAADTTWSALSTGLAQCSDMSASGQGSWTDGEALSFTVTATKPGAADQHVWLAREGNTVALLWIADQPGAVPAAVDGRVMEALVAGLQSPASYHSDITSGSVTSSASASASPVLALVGEGDLAKALGSWPNEWSRTAGSKVVADLPPCAQGWEKSHGTGGESAALGLNGAQGVDDFDSAGGAAASVATLTRALESCTSPTFQSVTTQPTAAGNTLLVAAGATAGDDVIWVVRRGAQVAFLVTPGSGTPPPDAVTQQVGSLLDDVLASQASVGSMSDAPTPSEGSLSPQASASTAPAAPGG